MLLSGSRGAPYTCLRCQLRQAIFHSQRGCIERPSIEARRPFSAAPRRPDQEDDTAIKTHRLRDGRPYYYHRPLGRIVGAPGRKQRQGTQKLKIDAMKKPFEVIVMQDVREPEEMRQPRKLQSGNTVSSAEIQKELEQEGQDPTQEEVNESISALRPETTLLDEEQYKQLAQRLSNGFTTEQLYNFFTHTVNLSAVESDTVHLVREQPSELQAQRQTTQWRPGRTSLEKRLPLGNVVTKSERPNKLKIVEHILRLTWSLSIHEEEQKGGEIEMKVETWEITYLFDLRSGDSPQYRWLVDSDLLLRACDIRPSRRSGHLRVYGRRQDAEEVLSRIATKLSGFGLLSVPLDTFKPLLGTPGWPLSLDKLFSEEQKDHVQNRTLAIVEQAQPGVLAIYGKTASRRLWARRLLLSLLEVPTPGLSKRAGDATRRHKGAMWLPESAGITLHLRHRNLGLARLATPLKRSKDSHNTTTRKTGTTASTSGFVSSATAQAMKVLGGVKSLTFPSPDQPASARWEPAESQARPWTTQICRVLSETSSTVVRSKMNRGTAARTFVNAQVPNLEALLSFFKPRHEVDPQPDISRSDTFLIARLRPSPFKAHGIEANKRLPPVEFTYSSYLTADGTPDVRFIRARAILDQQDVYMPLPSEATDLRFQRSATLSAQGPTLQQDSEVENFTQTLRESLQSAKIAGLAGRASVRMMLPDAVAQGLNEGNPVRDGDFGVSYLFMGFEQQQTMEYMPVPVESLPAKMDPELKAVLGSFGKDFYLKTREVRAGAVGGKRIEVWLRHERREKEDVVVSDGGEPASPDVDAPAASAEGGREDGSERDATSKAEEPEAIARQGIQVALGLTRLLTKINEGEVKMMLHHRARSDAEDADGEQLSM